MASTEVDNILPLSSVNIVAENAAENTDTAGIVFEITINKSIYTFYITRISDNLQNKFLNLCTPKLVCSSFSTLSGNNDDDLYSAQNLISNIKQSVSI